MKKSIKNIFILIACILISNFAYSQTKYKKLKKINLSKEVKKFQNDGFQYEKRMGFELAIRKVIDKENELDEDGNLKNLMGTGIESSYEQVSAKDNAGMAAAIAIATQISQQVNQIIERDIVDPGDQNVLKEYVNLATVGTSEKIQRNDLLVVYKKNTDGSYTYELTAYHNFADAMKLFNEQMAYQMNKVKAVETRKKYDGLLNKGLVDEVTTNVSEN